jgi:hypothetical protein
MDVIYFLIQAFLLTFVTLSAKRNGSDTEKNYTMQLFNRLKLLYVFTTEPNDKILKILHVTGERIRNSNFTLPVKCVWHRGTLR